MLASGDLANDLDDDTEDDNSREDGENHGQDGSDAVQCVGGHRAKSCGDRGDDISQSLHLLISKRF